MLVLNHLFQWFPWPWTASDTQVTRVVTPVTTTTTLPQVIDFNKVKDSSDPAQERLLERRKQDFGLDESVDMVVGSEESIKVGGELVPIRQILAEIEALKKAQEAEAKPEDPATPSTESRPVREDSLQSPGSDQPAPPEPATPTRIKKSIHYYGIHVVRPGDNLWNIHLKVLREYLKHRGHMLDADADEAGKDGRSSGIARILKYAEGMVHIFNLKTKQLDMDINMLAPEEKVVIFNLTRIDRILGQLKPGDLARIRFDGRELYLPEDRPKTAE